MKSNQGMGVAGLLKQANQLKRSGRLSEAIALYYQVIEVNPNFAWAYHNLADALVEQGNSDEAVTKYRQAIESNPNSAWFYISLSRVFRRQGCCNDAIDYLRKGIRVKPDLLYEFSGKYKPLFDSLYQEESCGFCLSKDEDFIELTEQPRWMILPVKPSTSYTVIGYSCSEQPPAYNQGLIQLELLDENKKIIPSPYSGIPISERVGTYIEIPTAGKHLSEFKTNSFNTTSDACYLRLGFRVWHHEKQIVVGSKLNLAFDWVVPLLENFSHNDHSATKDSSKSLADLVELKNIEKAIGLLRKFNKIFPGFYGVYDTLGDIFMGQGELSQAIRAYRQCHLINSNYCFPCDKLRQAYGVNNLNGWAISENLFIYILEILPIGSTILELGSGTGTLELSKYYNMVSIEHNQDWLNKYDSRYIYAPLINDMWYDVEVLRQELCNLDYHLILVDGPPKHRREGLLNHLNLFNWNVPIILDDVNRQYDMNLAISLAKHLGKIPTVYKDDKSFAVIARKSL